MYRLSLAKLVYNCLALHLVLHSVHAAPTALPTALPTLSLSSESSATTTTSTSDALELNRTSTSDALELNSTEYSNPAETDATPPPSPYNCSLTSRHQLNYAIASFRQGWTLIVDILNTHHLKQLKASPTPSFCPQVPLSTLNRPNYRDINQKLSSPQAVANTIGKLQAYMSLITISQSRAYSDTMQALYDMLDGTAEDLYDVLAPTYCNCTPPSTTATKCFTIPQLQTSYRWNRCNLVSYISIWIAQELFNARTYSYKWLKSQELQPLPPVTTSDWLASHVPTNSPAITKVMQRNE